MLFGGYYKCGGGGCVLATISVVEEVVWRWRRWQQQRRQQQQRWQQQLYKMLV